MKIALVAMFFATSAFAQGLSAVVPAACGPANFSFKVKLDKTIHAPGQPAPGKALIYFFHGAGMGGILGYPTLKLGVDGAWVGANHGDSYFAASVDPGEHHVCATLQSNIVGDRVELAHFTVEAGKVYYYRARLVLSRSIDLLELDRIDSNQAKYLIATLPLSVSNSYKVQEPRQSAPTGTR